MLCVFSLSSEQISNNEKKSPVSSSNSNADNAGKRIKVRTPRRKASDGEKLRQQQQQQRQDFTHLVYQDSSSSGDGVHREERIAIDYMAKDYASFRAPLLDLIPRKIPQWKDKSEADIGIMLIELFSLHC